MADPHSDSSAPSTLRVLVYSDDRLHREQIRLALGRRIAADLPEVVLTEVATRVALMQAMDAGGVDLAILDGEASPAGGIGMARQLRDEIAACPPLLVLVARPQDAWLATWSGADAALALPVDPIRLPEVAARLLRGALSGSGR